MILVDTSVWVELLRDREGAIVQAFHQRVQNEIYVLSRFTQLELLQGAKNQTEWDRLEDYLATQYYLEATESTWVAAARIYFELRRQGKTVNSPIDCCIAQLAIQNRAILLHRDHDFSTIAKVRPLPAEYFSISGFKATRFSD
ncbi:PIN domain nuclease [Acidobacteria bacterium AH-259-O06]|nr:PIN domain nuclease [Acidobacteria bacterium AH-259-O06]